jgi:hypothetical protein
MGKDNEKDGQGRLRAAGKGRKGRQGGVRAIEMPVHECAFLGERKGSGLKVNS